MSYPFGKIEKKWTKKWLDSKLYEPDLKKAKKPYYNLMMFPYPSAEGLHVGNMYAFTGSDIYGRYQRMQGNDVFEPIGLDGFGIHSENYALKIGTHPMKHAEVSEKNFYRQLQSIGNGFAWNERLETYDPEYYKWTQWIFVQLFKRGLAYRKKQSVNWCPSCKTVLADEQVILAPRSLGEVGEGKCERCSTKVIKKELEQWFFKITKYADRLLSGLEKLDWSERVKIAQRNWIGKSEGSEIGFEIPADYNYVFLHGFDASPKEPKYNWIKKQLEARSPNVFFPQLPNAGGPTEKEWVDHVLKNGKFNSRTILCGKSLGAVTALKVLEKIDRPIAGVVLIGGFLDGTKLKSKYPFERTFKWNYDFNKIKKNIGFIKILHDLKDKAVPDEQAKLLHKNLGGELIEVIANKPHFGADEEPSVIDTIVPKIKVFTTRPDTIFGATYMVLAPEHPLIQNLESRIKNLEEVKRYIKEAKSKTEEERVAEGKVKTGVELKGVKATNPATKKEIPIWVADYVLGSVGTGAIMAVPAHDERDFEFAKKFSLPITQVIRPLFVNPQVRQKPKEIKFVKRKTIHGLIVRPKDNKILVLDWKKWGWKTLIIGGCEGKESPKSAALREAKEETGLKVAYKGLIGGEIESFFFADHKNEWRHRVSQPVLLEATGPAKGKISEEEAQKHNILWMDPREALKILTYKEDLLVVEQYINGTMCYPGEGTLINSGKFSGMDSEKVKWEITKFVGGKGKTQYRLRDWLISRQRYWGPPIPMIFCGKCDWQPVSEKDLPVKLPLIKDFRPKGKGESPLASVKSFYETKCPKCGGKAKRETDVSDTFLDSAWYFFRYLDHKNRKEPFSRSRVKKWLPVNMYIGGAEHSVLHLLYSRFITMFFRDMKLINFSEPYTRFRANGLLISEGAKMSKSKGNVVVPDIYIQKFGADAIRLYLMFLGPFEQGGDWRDAGIMGPVRFLDRVWTLAGKVQMANSKGPKAVSPWMHVHIKEVTEDIAELKYNTAISELMVVLNKLEKEKELNKKDLESFLLLLAPFAPFIAEELWSRFFANKKSRIRDSRSESGEKTLNSIHLYPWPKYDAKHLIRDTFTLIVQINGKLRAQIAANRGIAQKEAEKLALADPRVQKLISDKKIRRIIFVKGKLINLVV